MMKQGAKVTLIKQIFKKSYGRQKIFLNVLYLLLTYLHQARFQCIAYLCFGIF